MEDHGNIWMYCWLNEGRFIENPMESSGGFSALLADFLLGSLLCVFFFEIVFLNRRTSAKGEIRCRIFFWFARGMPPLVPRDFPRELTPHSLGTSEDWIEEM